MSQALLAYARRLCQISCCVFLASHLWLLNLRSFLSTKMFQSVISLKRSQICETLLTSDGMFFPNIPCYQIRGLMGIYVPLAFHGVNDTNGKIPCSTCNSTIPKSMCDGYWDVGHTHMAFVISVLNKPSTPWVNCNWFVPLEPNVCYVGLLVYSFGAPNLACVFSFLLPLMPLCAWIFECVGFCVLFVRRRGLF